MSEGFTPSRVEPAKLAIRAVGLNLNMRYICKAQKILTPFISEYKYW